MAAPHPQLARLLIPPQGPHVPPALYTPGLPTVLQQSFNIATPLNTTFGAQIPPHPNPRHGIHRAHPSLMFAGPAAALAAAGIAPHSGMPMTPAGIPPNMMFGAQGFQRVSRRTPSMSTGGPPKAALGGPNKKHNPMPAATPVPAANPSLPSERPKPKKVILKLPVESIVPDGGESSENVVYSMWSRKPLPHTDAPKMDGVFSPEILSAEMLPFEQSSTLPATIDVFLPGKDAWEEYKQNLIEEKLQRLGVERGGSSGPPGQSRIHGRAASISSPADPALLLFKLNKLQQSQNGSISVSPQPSLSSISISPHPPLPPRLQNLAPRHGHSFSLANLNPPAQVNTLAGEYNQFGLTPPPGPDQVFGRRISPVPTLRDRVERDLPPHLHAPQGIIPLSLNMQSDTTTASSGPSSRVASTIPDFTRGFGLDIPEEDEAEVEAFSHLDTMTGLILPGQGAEKEIREVEDDATTMGAHSRHISKVSVALSSKSMDGRSGKMEVESLIEEVSPPELEKPVEWNINGDNHSQQDMVDHQDPADEWTASEDDGNLEEYSNPSDEERAMQARQERHVARTRQRPYGDHETPRRLPDFPSPPEAGPEVIPNAPSAGDDDIVSNPSEEDQVLGQHVWLRPRQLQQDLALFQPVVDGRSRSPRPLPPLPHSRSVSGNYSHPSTLPHSRHPSSRVNELEPSSSTNGSLLRRESLNPFAKPFVFGAPLGTQASNNPSSEVNPGGHVRQPSSGRALNAAAAEFKPGFTFLPPAGVPKLSFPAVELSRPLPQPPPGISPSRMQGREKRQRRASSVGDSDVTDEEREGRNTMSSFRFPPSSPPTNPTEHLAVSPIQSFAGRALSPIPRRKSELNAAAVPFTFPVASALPLHFPSKGPSSLPYPLVVTPSAEKTQANAPDLQHDSEGTAIALEAETQDVSQDIVSSSEPSPSPARKRPPVLDFKHPVSANTVPAAFFRRSLMSGDFEGPTRPAVRSRLSSREIFEHVNSPSLDDTKVLTISRMANLPPTNIPEALQSQSAPQKDQPVDIPTPTESMENMPQDSKLSLVNSGIASPISESMLFSYPDRREADQIEQRLGDMLDDRIELAKRDLAEAHGQASDGFVGQVITAIKTHLSELVTRRLEEGMVDARGEVDFELIRNTLEQGVMDIRTGLRRDLEDVLRSVESAHLARERSSGSFPADLQRIMEEFGNRTVSAVSNAVVKFATRIDQIDEFARVRASDERELLLGDLFDALAPRLESLRPQPIDFDDVTAKLAEAVKPHISQLIDLTSDKKETAGLILQRLMPTLSALSQTPAHVDTDAIVSQLRVEVARMAPASDPHAIKEAVADLVVERLDSRLAVREKLASSELLYSRISERIDDLHAPVSDVRKAVEELHMGQEFIKEQGTILNTLHQDMASQLLSLPDAIHTAIAVIRAASERLTFPQDTSSPPSTDVTQVLPQLQSINSTVQTLGTSYEHLMSQSANLVGLHEALQATVSSLPNSVAEAITTFKHMQEEFLSSHRIPDQSAEIRNLSASNGDLQVQLAKARGAHGQVRVEKDLMFDRMTIAEAERDSLRAQLEELRSKSAAKETEVAAAGLRITGLEDALSHAQARLQSSDVTTKAMGERISTLERQNRDLGLEQYQYKSQIQKLELQEEWLTRDKDNLEQRLAQLQKDRDTLAFQQSHWEELRRTSDQVEQLTRLIAAADSAEMAELKRASDRGKLLEGEHASLQKRFKEQEAKIANIERASQTARQGMAQAQQRASEWEKRTKDLEADLDATRASLDEADEAKLQLKSDLLVAKLHLEEKEATEEVTKAHEAELRAEVSSLEAQLSMMKTELEKVNQARQPPIVNASSTLCSSPPRWGTNGYVNGQDLRPSSRASTVYGARSPVTPTDVTYRSGTHPSRAPSVAPSSPKGVWGSMHAPLPSQHVSTTMAYPPRSAIPSPTPSTVSVAPTQGDDGWWS